MRKCDACDNDLGDLTKYQALFGYRCPACDYWHPPVKALPMVRCVVAISEEFIIEESISQLMRRGEWHGLLLTDVSKATTMLEEEMLEQATIYDR